MYYGNKLISRGPAIELSVLSNVGIAVVKFDATGKRVNVLSSAVMAELDAVLDMLATGKLGDRRIYGAVFVSGKHESFIVGADINEIVVAQTMPKSVAYEGSENGKAILAKLAALPFPTVAAIDGRCLGGGAELALACDERIVTGNTFIGLPEVGLGVLPGWGGTVTAPRLIGFAAALPLILNPLKAWSAKRAWKRGLVSQVVEERDLMDCAVTVALGGEPRRAMPTLIARIVRTLCDSALGRSLCTSAMEFIVQLKMGKKYPAPFAALKVMNAAFDLPASKARELESATFAELCQTPACKSCVQKFLEYQKSKKDKKGSNVSN